MKRPKHLTKNLGTHALMGTPTEQIGFQASEEYASRMSSPRPQGLGLAHSNASETHVESPLKKESCPENVPGKSEFEGTLERSLETPSNTSLASASEVEDDVIHVDAPGRRISKVYGGAGHIDSIEDLGPHTGHGGIEDGIHDEHGYGAPILASDEVAKEPFGWELQPAVSPMNERHGSSYDEPGYHHRSGSQSSANGSRPSSRPGSIHGTLPGMRLPGSAPLEDLDEYEPLFPEDEKKAAGIAKPLTPGDKLKRPELKNRKFPSQDVWEDTPNSLQYTATVSSPQLPEDAEESRHAGTRGEETPAQAFARKQEELAEIESKNLESFLHAEQKKKVWSQKSHLAAETRLGLAQRFPSRDIWEDAPDSLQLQTTVAGPQSEDREIISPPDDQAATGTATYHQAIADHQEKAAAGISIPTKPQIPARPARSKLSQSPETSHPAIPERPARSKQVSVEGTTPPVPMKAKPQVPARPSKPITRESSENIPLTTVTSNSSAKSVGSDTSSAAAAKPKPPVPSRPLGSKIAALQGGFMSDLNKRLQLGPQGPKNEEPAPEAEEEVKEKAPLSDARKGRARGPARRAPAKSPAPAAAATTEKPASLPAALSFSMPLTVWSIDPTEDSLRIASHQEDTKAVQSETPTLAANTAGQPLHDSTEIARGADKSASITSPIEDIHAQQDREAENATVAAKSFGGNHDLEPVKASDEPLVEPHSTLAPETAEEEDLLASTAMLKAAEPKEEVVE
jgi:hypothetical protein